MADEQIALSTEDREFLEGFAKNIEDMRTLYTKAKDETAKLGTVTTETSEAVRKQEAKLDDMGKKVEELGRKSGEDAERLAKIEADLRIVKQRSYRPPGMTEPPTPGRLLTFGERFTATDGFKNLTQVSGKFKTQILVAGRMLHPYMERKAITEAASGYPIVPTRIGIYPSVPLQQFVMRDLLTVVPLSGTNAVEYLIENWTYNADYQIAEGDRKAEGTVVYTDASVMVRTIAWFVKISRQMLSDVPYIAQTVDTRLIYGVQKKEEREILYGDNAAGHLHGIMPQATATPADVLGVGVVETRIDEILSAVAYLASQGYPPTAVVVNALTWAGMSISKNTMGGYILGGPPASEAVPRLWGLPLVATPEMAANDYLVGQFPGNAILFDRESVAVDVAYENEDDFVRNMVTFRAEERIALAVVVPKAFAKGPFRMPAPALGRSEAPRQETKK